VKPWSAICTVLVLMFSASMAEELPASFTDNSQARLASLEKTLVDKHEDIGVRLRVARRIAELTDRDVFEVARRVEKLQRYLSRGEMGNHLACFNLFEEKPEAVQRLYVAAYKLLEADINASYTDLSSDATIQQICEEIGMTHFGGPMLGAVASNGARVWVRTLRPGKVTVRVEVDGTEKTFGPVGSTRQSRLTAIVPVTGMRPGTSYPYRVFVDGKPIKMSETAALVTAPESGKVRIAFGSCSHRWGLGNPKLSAAIRNRRPAGMLLIGDIAAQDRNNHIGLHRSDYLMRDLQPAWQDLVATVPVYATWDDHDYFDNDKAGIPHGKPEKGIVGYADKDRRAVWSVFRECWNNPSYGFGEEGQGVFLRTRIGPCDIIMTDNRYFRENKEGSFLGDRQMKWLKQQLLDCRGPFIILSGGTMWSDYIDRGKDSWGKWDPEGREEILCLIEEHRIGGVLFISGDRHGARGFKMPRPSGRTFYEFEPASLGGRWGPGVKSRKNQLFGFDRQVAFGEFSIDATLDDPEVTFRLIRDNGRLLYELTLKRSQLQ
jgi:alkaline phosphatase D